MGEQAVDFERDVKPIFLMHCRECHGADKQESGLRLDTPSGLRAGGNSGPALVAGNVDGSLLIQAITGTGEASKMPPKGPGPSADEIALLKRWVAEGAGLPADTAADDKSSRRGSDHWAFQPIKRPTPPDSGSAWIRNPIDAFILEKLAAAKLTPSAEADRATLLRRVCLDLTGLPPTIADIDAFLADGADDAYERLVDRLLASPQYGERWGRHWLDVARYADSNGYTIDGGRSIWKYRDWVIQALNRDLPFDQFTIEQIAGDMLPDARVDQIVATGFHRNTLVNEEGGTDPEQFRIEAIVDRVSTTGAAFLGLTLGCARCHDHKYDPISQREFYQLFALLNNADEPTLGVPTDKQAKEMPALLAEIEQTEKRLADVEVSSAGRQGEWERKLAGRPPAEWTVLAAEATSEGGATISPLDDGSLLVAGTIPAQDAYTLISPIGGKVITALRLEVLTHDSLPKQGPGLADNGDFILGEISVSMRTGASDSPLSIVEGWADHSGNKGAVELAIDGHSATGWNIAAPKDANTARTAVFYLRDRLEAPADGRLKIVLEQKSGKSRHQIGRFRIATASAERDLLKLSAAAREALAVSAADRTPEQKEALRAEFQKVDPERVPLAARIAELKEREKQIKAAITTTLVLRERKEPRPTRIHLRGDFLHPGAPVEGGVPGVLGALVARGERPDRLDLARWLVSRDNPLTARVTANRVWQVYFGRGLVATENDFGLQGDLPTHPELLDWLAGWFVDNGWSLKRLHRLIVTSATYRQSSRMRDDLTAADPENKLLGRQRRLRLEAETIRDSALAASGLLSAEIGGPGVFPPQPQGIYRFTQQVKFWGESHDADRYRRGLYTYFWRSSPDPFLKTFDAPDANVACTRRVRSNTPLQSLTLANDRAFFEMAQALAASVLAAPLPSDAERIRAAFRRCLVREPSESELVQLARYVAAQRRAFEAAPDGAAKVAPSSSAEPARVAAWTMLARVLLNLDEFVTRE